MTATLAAPVRALPSSRTLQTYRPAVAPARALSVPVIDYHRAIAAGAVAVDIRSQATRERDGVLFGAIAVAADIVLERLTPGGAEALRGADYTTQWLLISDDGHDAEWLAWHLQARGVVGARFVVGGARRMRSRRINGPVSAAELAMIAAH